MLMVKYLLRDLYRYIFRYIPWIIIGFLISILFVSSNVSAASYLTPPDAALTCLSGTCNNWNENATFNTATTRGITFRSLNFAKRRDIDVVKYGYLNDSLISRYEYYDLSFSIQYTHVQQVQIMPVKVNNYNCTGTLEGPFVDGSITTAPLVNYTCTGVQINNSKYAFILEFPIAFVSGDTTTNFYIWISPLYYSVNQNYTTDEKLEDINDTLTDSNVNVDNFNDTNVNNDNGIITAILTMPVDLLSSIINGLSNNTSCTPIKFNLPFVDNEVVIPCFGDLMIKMNFYTWWESTGAVAGGILMFNYLIYLGKELHDMMTLKETRAEWGGL